MMQKLVQVVVVLGIIGLLMFGAGCGDDGENGESPLIGTEGEAGGLIFYVDTAGKYPGWTYLEAAPEDIEIYIPDEYHVWEFIWGDIEQKIGGLGSGVGTGAANTTAIRAALGDDFFDGEYAARLCDEYAYGGKTDWFLPSLDELATMYAKLHARGLGDFSAGYWSSTEHEEHANLAWCFRFNDGETRYHSKGAGFRVRPVRAY